MTLKEGNGQNLILLKIEKTAINDACHTLNTEKLKITSSDQFLFFISK